MVRLILSLLFMFSLSSPVLAQRGCCSHHGGVASCGEDGYQQCRDGSESPSCTCGNQQKIQNPTQYIKRGKGYNLFSQSRPFNPYLEPLAVTFWSLNENI